MAFRMAHRLLADNNDFLDGVDGGFFHPINNSYKAHTSRILLVLFLSWLSLFDPDSFEAQYGKSRAPHMHSSDKEFINYSSYIFTILAILVASLEALHVARGGYRKYRLWQENNEFAKHHIARKHLDDIISRFDQLSPDDQEHLVAKGLASKDSSGNYSLRFICPMSKNLILEPAVLRVEKACGGEDFDIYEKSIISNFLVSYTGNRSPATSRPIIQNNGQIVVEAYANMPEYHQYIKELDSAIPKFGVKLKAQ